MLSLVTPKYYLLSSLECGFLTFDACPLSHGSATDEQIQSALAGLEQAVRNGSSSRPELGDDCAEPDTTGQSLVGPDSYDSDSTWVNRFRRTGGHASGEHGRSKQASGLGDEVTS